MDRTRPIITIEAGRAATHYWRDLWRYRELFYFLAWRDVLVRYKQTVAGVAWALLRPLFTMVVFSVVFGRLAGMPAGDVPYPLLVYAGILPWQLFASAFSDAGNSLVGNANLITKVYFPRLIIPASAVVVALVDFAFSLLVLALLMAWYGLVPDARVLALPLFVALAGLTAFGGAVWIAALNVRYRDFRHLIPFAVLLGTFISPVGYSATVVPDAWRFLYALNPMVGVIDGFRWCLLAGRSEPDWQGIALSVGMLVALLWYGLRYFRATERTFADVI